ncbi:MAG: hypothetical protein II652_03150 [Bacteroidales bacterium]|nr:hypothetical protein [Bacteroidales bacterium]
MHPKFIIVSDPGTPLSGSFVYGLVGSHRELVKGYVKVHGGGWYLKDDVKKTMTLYGSSGDYGEPRLAFLNRIPKELRDYRFIFSPGWNLPGNVLDLSEVEWF